MNQSGPSQSFGEKDAEKISDGSRKRACQMDVVRNTEVNC